MNSSLANNNNDMLSRSTIRVTRALSNYQPAANNANNRAFSLTLDGYGTHLFKGATASPYLQKHNLPANTLETPKWTTDGNADKVIMTSYF